MKLISIHNLFEGCLFALKRFTFAIICAIAISITAILIIDSKEAATVSLLRNLLMSLSLGMVSFIGVSVFSQRYTIRKSTLIAFHAIIVALMIYFFFAQPDVITVKSICRFVILSLAVHLGVSFAPYMVDVEINGFWQYNKSLFLRFLTSILYSSFLFLGLSLALFTIGNLFDIEINYKLYQRLFIVIFVLFNTWFFLAGMPERIIKLQLLTDYPKSLRVFTQFVLLPLITIYLLILYAYGANIAFNIVWPRGYVSYLVIGFSCAGILALLLVWPLRSEEKYKWITTYTNWFFKALFPLIVLLGMAIGRRVIEYGVTENRYFVIILSIWLFINALYFLYSERKNIKFIPMSLFFTALISGFGPWNAFQVSQESQLSRLEKLLEKNKVLSNGIVINPGVKLKAISISDRREVSNIVDYLTEVHGVESMQKFFKDNLVATVNKPTNDTDVKSKQIVIMDQLGIDYLFGMSLNSDIERKGYNFSSKYSKIVDVSNYNYYIPLDLYVSEDKASFNCKLDSTSLSITYKKGSWDLNLKNGNESNSIISIKNMIYDLEKNYTRNNFNIPEEKMTLEFEDSKGWKYKLIIRGITGLEKSGTSGFNLSSLNGVLLVRKQEVIQ